jgi:hypothetical protein
MSKEPMRFTEEFARHKILDLVGDLMLRQAPHGPRHRREARPRTEHGDGARALAEDLPA